MDILNELRLSKIQTDMVMIKRIIAIIIAIFVFFLVEIGLYIFIFSTIDVKTAHQQDATTKNTQYYYHVIDNGDSADTYDIYMQQAGAWSVYEDASYATFTTIYLDKSDESLMVEGQPNPWELGIINIYHYIIFGGILFAGLSFIVSDPLKKILNKKMVYKYLLEYDTSINEEKFDYDVLSKVVTLKYINEKAEITVEESILVKQLKFELLERDKYNKKMLKAENKY